MTVRSILILLSITVLIGTTGCVTMLSSRGTLVRIEKNIEMVVNCKFMGTVKGASLSGWNKEQKTENALNDIRNNAALLGANTVIISSMDTMFEGTAVRGGAYHCPLNLKMD